MQSPPIFSSLLFIAIIDIFHVVSKNILDNSDCSELYYTTKNTKNLHKVHKVSLIDYTLFPWDFQLVTFHFQLMWA